MEDDGFDSFHPETDVPFPPRKRLLTGLKRQSSGSTSQYPGSPESSSSIPFDESNARLQNLLKSYKNGFQTSPDQIAEAAESAAFSAAKAAMAARAIAEEKAAIALKAVATAKEALSSVASFSQEIGSLETQSRKNKMKKNVPVQKLYTNPVSDENFGRDAVFEVENSDSQASKSSKSDSVGEISGEEEELGHSRKNLYESVDDLHVNVRERGRTEHKKPPLSFCSLKDRGNPSSDDMMSSVEAHPNTSVSTESAHTCKFQGFKVPQYIKPSRTRAILKRAEYDGRTLPQGQVRFLSQSSCKKRLD